MQTFSFGVFWRIILLAIFVCPIPFFIEKNQWTYLFFCSVGFLIVASNLYFYATNINKKLVRFLESVRYSDFTVKFRADNKLGSSFSELNQQYNEVLEAFRQARAEKEANLQYLNTIVQQIGTGLLVFDTFGKIELINSAALKMLGTYRLRNLTDLKDLHPVLYEFVIPEQNKENYLYRTPTDQPLAIHTTRIQLRGKMLKIVVLQNIRSELQQQEVESWQNLTRVLRHEIMNSLTPILSLIGTMKDIVELDLQPIPINSEPIADLKEAIETLQRRGTGIIQFVNSYRDYTTLPPPQRQKMSVDEIMNQVLQLTQETLNNHAIKIINSSKNTNLSVLADVTQIEQVLINILKNAQEALAETENPTIEIKAFLDQSKVYIFVKDNGSGIEPEALEKIFIPFYTTKKTGSGIGLSLSRQIMQQNGGYLWAESEVGKGTVFWLMFGE